MVKRFVVSSVSTHNLIPSRYPLLYPLGGASRVTHMLALSIKKDTAFAEPCPWAALSSHNNGCPVWCTSTRLAGPCWESSLIVARQFGKWTFG